MSNSGKWRNINQTYFARESNELPFIEHTAPFYFYCTWILCSCTAITIKTFTNRFTSNDYKSWKYKTNIFFIAGDKRLICCWRGRIIIGNPSSFILTT